MSYTDQDVISWWKTAILSTRKENRPPYCNSNHGIVLVFGRTFPSLALISNLSLNNSEFWGKIREYLRKLTCQNDVPNPIEEYNAFIKFLYFRQSLILPNTIDEANIFLCKFMVINNPNSLFYKFPIMLGNPELFFSLLSKIWTEKSNIWYAITGSPILGSIFIENYLHCLDTCDLGSGFHIKSMISEIMVEILQNNVTSKIFFSEYSEKYIKQVCSLIGNTTHDMYISFLRHMLIVHRLQIPMFRDSDDDDEPSYEASLYILEVISKYMPCIDYTIHFFCIYSPDIFKSPDFPLRIGLFLPGNVQPFFVLSRAFHIMPLIVSLPCFGYLSIKSKVFHRSCMSFIQNGMSRAKLLKETKNWIFSYIRGLFILIVLCGMINKYINKVALICETISSMLAMPDNLFIDWILENAAAAAYTKYIPPCFFRFFPHNVKKDRSFNDVLDATMSESIDLKTFPFQTKNIALFQSLIPTKENRPKMKKLIIEKRIVKKKVIHIKNDKKKKNVSK